MPRTLILALLAVASEAQHYCWPCAERYGVIGKYTYAASDPPACFDWYMKYLNNIVPGCENRGPGWKTIGSGNSSEVVSDSDPPNVMAVEVNECGTSLGNRGVHIAPMGPADWDLVRRRQRLPTGDMHQCPCAVQGRANIINGTVDAKLSDFSSVEAAWGKEYTDRVRAMGPASWKRFGVHGVFCSFHSSGPCSLAEVEEGVARAWAGNFSRGYVPLMDNSLMLRAETLGPLLDAFLRDGVEFYPMRWTAATAPGTEPVEMYSVLASPCGKVLIEVAAPCPGGRPAHQFHRMEHARAALEHWNKPADDGSQPLVPLRISKAVGADKLDEVLAFYGVGGTPETQRNAAALGFRARVLADDTDSAGLRAITVMLSPSATTHMQFWARPEEEPTEGPKLPPLEAFRQAADRSQIDPVEHQDFCGAEGAWTVRRYISYQLLVHETVMEPVPSDPDTDSPPAGFAQDIFIDDHFSWDCTAPECDVAEGGKALYRSGSRVQWMDASDRGFPGWGPYGYDPAGYGIQLHWANTPAHFRPQGESYPICFQAQADGTCQGAHEFGAPEPPRLRSFLGATAGGSAATVQV